ncbi:Uncharacterised protein [Acinetobacter baumannii]|nr:Uncharacterised protein [Acinetobacter baumannii]
MTLQADQNLRPPAPATNHPCQRCQQQVVDLCAVGCWRLLQQATGRLARQPGISVGNMPLLTATFGTLARQIRAHALQRLSPITKLTLDGFAAGMLLQAIGPSLERTGFRRQVRRLSSL